MSIALDVGAFQLRSLRRNGDRLLGRRCRTLLAALPDSPESVRLLHRSGIAYATCEKHLVVLGDDAVEVSQSLQSTLHCLLPEGRLPPADPFARQALATLIEALIPEPQRRKEICCLTLPGAAASRSNNGSPEREFITRLLRKRGYSPRVISAGLALCLAELVDRAFTGIGLSFGAATCDASLCHRGIEIIRCTVPQGAGPIDARIANQTAKDNRDSDEDRHFNLEAVRIRRESVQGSLPGGDDEFALTAAKLYREWVGEVVDQVADELTRCRYVQSLPQPIDIVIGGGSTRIDGFRALVEQSVGNAVFPVAINDLRVASEPDYSVARGCLIYAELESEPGGNSLRAA